MRNVDVDRGVVRIVGSKPMLLPDTLRLIDEEKEDHPTLEAKLAYGYWYSDDRKELPHPTDFIDHNWSDEEREKVARYLDAGEVVTSYRGLSWCRICPLLHRVGNKDMTDGVYVYPDGLSHYVRKHGVRVPMDMQERAMSKDATMTGERPNVSGILDTLREVFSAVVGRPSEEPSKLDAGEKSIDLTGHTLHFINSFDDATFAGIHFSGLCGGMTYTVLDHFYTKTPAPLRTTVPPMTDALGKYIHDRQVDTLLGWHAVRFLAMLANPDDSSIARLTDASFDELRGAIDAGTPVPLGLIPDPWTIDVTKFTRAHQVVARGYRVDEDGTRSVLIWDPNRPESTDVKLVRAPGMLLWAEAATGNTWRGFFVESGYTVKEPPRPADVSTPAPVVSTPDASPLSSEPATPPVVSGEDHDIMISWSPKTSIENRLTRLRERRSEDSCERGGEGEVSDKGGMYGGVEVAGGFDFASPIASAIATAGHSETLKDLSPMAGVLASSIDAGIGSALGLSTSLSAAGAEITKDIASNLAASVGDSVASMVGDVAQVVPIVGTFIKFAISFLTSMAPGPPPGESASQECQQLFTNLPPQKSGSMLGGGASAPADYFANVNPLAFFWLGPSANPSNVNALQKDIAARSTSFYVRVGPLTGSVFSDSIRPSFTSGLVNPSMPPTVPFYIAGPMKCRSAMGMALMQITEGMVADLDDFDWKHVLAAALKIEKDSPTKSHGKNPLKDAKQVRSLWEKAVERDANVLVRSWKKLHPKDTKAGLPKAWRDRFRTLRRGIEGSYFANAKTTTDGGAALWITYMDLIAQAYTKGYLNNAFVEWIFARQMSSVPLVGGDWDRGTFPTSDALVAENLWCMLNERLLVARPDSVYVDGGWTAAPMTWVWFRDPCPRMTAYQIKELSQSWINTTHPHYAMGREKLAEIMTQAKTAAVAHGKNIHMSKSAASSVENPVAKSQSLSRK